MILDYIVYFILFIYYCEAAQRQKAESWKHTDTKTSIWKQPEK